MNYLEIKPYEIKTQDENTSFSIKNKFLEFYIDGVPLCEYILKKYSFSIFDNGDGIGGLGWFTSIWEEKILLKQLLKIPLTEVEFKEEYPEASQEDIEDLLLNLEKEKIWIYVGACCGDPLCYGWNVEVTENIDTFTWQLDENITFEFEKKNYQEVIMAFLKMINDKNIPLKYVFGW